MDGFFDRIREGNFTYRGIVITKKDIYSRELRRSKESFHRFVVKEMLMYDNRLDNALIYIDKMGDKDFKREWRRYLLKEINSKSKKIKTVEFRDSKKSNPIQLADMVAGAIRKSLQETPGSVIYRDLIKPKEIDVWDYCKIHRNKKK